MTKGKKVLLIILAIICIMYLSVNPLTQLFVRIAIPIAVIIALVYIIIKLVKNKKS